MKLYRIILFLFAASLLMGAMNSLGVFDTKLPVQDTMNIEKSKIEEITDTTDIEPSGLFDSLLGGFRLIGMSLGFIKEAVMSILNLDDTLEAYNIPVEIITMIMGMLILVAVFGILKWLTGRSDKGIE